MRLCFCFVFLVLFGSVSSVCATDYLFFNGNYLQLRHGNDEIVKTWFAKAGKPKSTPLDQSKKNFGPLPEGYYVVRYDQRLSINKESSMIEKLRWLVKYPAWGFAAVRLDPFSTNVMYNRNGFYIHGGGWFMGSKGCIYLKSENSDFQAHLKKYASNLVLKVAYNANAQSVLSP